MRFGTRGQADLGIGSVITLLIIVAVGAVVVYQITGALPRTTGSYADNAISNVESTGSIVFQLSVILAVVLVAATIIAVIMEALGGARRTVAPPMPAGL
jgi:preprotein translocase subunit SecY